MNSNPSIQNMKTKPHPARTSKKTAAPTTSDPTPINITTEEGKKIRECAAKTGQTVDQFIRKVVLERCAKLEDDALTAIPCPYCKRTDSLEIISWSNERKDGTEYVGDAVRCRRCDSIASADSWSRLGTPILSPQILQGLTPTRRPAMG